MILAKSLAITMLLFASLSKLSVLIGYPGETSMASMAIAIAEGIFGLWWLFTARDDVAIGIAIPLFSLCLGVSVAKTLQHKESCGCYGSVEVSPAISAGLDLIVIGSLLFAGIPREARSHPGPAEAGN